MDALIRETEEILPVPSTPATPTNWVPQTLHDLRTDPGRAGLATFLREVAKLRCIRVIGLPASLFAELPSAVLHRYRQRVDGERPSEVLAHPDPIRATLLAAWLVEREQEITDTLVDLLIQLMHRIVTRAEEKVETAYGVDPVSWSH
ncbi:MAG: hypothetical protein H0X24_10085 [Ktedonobacterales bacterium]|nr:hypothetical protein [Ktedonobacterales bacterium]